MVPPIGAPGSAHRARVAVQLQRVRPSQPLRKLYLRGSMAQSYGCAHHHHTHTTLVAHQAHRVWTFWLPPHIPSHTCTGCYNCQVPVRASAWPRLCAAGVPHNTPQHLLLCLAVVLPHLVCIVDPSHTALCAMLELPVLTTILATDTMCGWNTTPQASCLRIRR